ncbi:transglutaminaseTgpA domain-containing protein [Saccharothrix sp. NPDC042600]|uniref:transglutaminaseTgpA domain-containing protein n=1 Tax=Saccharothrix TaxID=2071 RepID=UPI003408D446
MSADRRGGAVTGPGRVAVAGLLGAAGVAGLLFSPVFGLFSLLLPVFVVLAAAFAAVEVCSRWPALVPVRPVLVLVLGLLGLVESVLFPTTLAGLPTGASLSVLWRGGTQGWLLTLQSTWPARPEPELLLFVPLAVLLAVVLGTEVLLRSRVPGAALLPVLAVAGLAQLYRPVSGVAAVVAGVAFALPAGLVLVRHTTVSGARVRRAAVLVAAVAVGAVALGGFDPLGRTPVRLEGDAVALRQHRVGNPLNEVARRLAEPEREVFRYRADARVDRWSLVVLDGFDGANWTADPDLRRLGARREGAGARTAEVTVEDLTGPWLPSQPSPLAVDGLAPLVDESAGTLLLDRTAGPRRYTLTWSEPGVAGDALGAATVDPHADGGLGGVGAVPPEVGRLARESVRGLRPTVQSALQLERFLARNHRVADGRDLPTGSGWPQLRRFLTETKRGTSEQFAAAYVALARLNGIPARLVVGYRGGARDDDGSFVVRNKDVLAWPEIAVTGVGWVPLDPTATAVAGGVVQVESTGLAKAAAQAREQLPPEDELRPPEQPREDVEVPATAFDVGVVTLVAGAVVVGFAVCWLVGVPLAKAARRRRRRRRTGADGVVAAWAEVCDRLRAHGVPFRIGMTPRDLASAAGEATAGPVTRLGRVLDMALWSGVPVSDGSVRKAWQEERLVREVLAARPRGARLRAALDPRPLFGQSVQRAPRTATGSLV